MKIDTTINIKKEILERIDSACNDYSISRSMLVSLLLKSMIKAQRTDKNRFSRVKYQKRDKNAQWKRPHVVLEYDLYEKCIDMRKLAKMSVSYIVSISFNLFLNEIFESLKNGEDTDKNLRQYICIGKRYGSVYSYTVFWDFPSEDILLKHLE